MESINILSKLGLQDQLNDYIIDLVYEVFPHIDNCEHKDFDFCYKLICTKLADEIRNLK